MFRRKNNLRARIMATFSLLLLVTFLVTGLAFNFAVNLYIRAHAATVLQGAIAESGDREVPENIELLLPDIKPGDGPQRFILGNNLNVFLLTEGYKLVSVPSQSLEAAEAITEFLKSNSLSLDSLTLQFIRTGERIFYASAAWIQNDSYAVYYVDVTGLSAFAGMVNILLLSLVGLIWLLSSAAVTFLAGSITRPISVLSKFSQQIGHGHFSPNEMCFSNIEFEALNQSLNQTARQLAQYDNEQKIFFQNVSHELRTPLMSIKCYAEGIKYGVMEPKEASKTILAETDRLTEMVDDILYISRIDNLTTAQLTEQADIGKLVADCVSKQQAVAENRQLRLIFETDANDKAIKCAPKHISRAADNLISNALRYAESVVTVSCTMEPAYALIKITDDGPGISPNDLPHIFERFYKGSGGLNGIGLSMVKSIVEQHKGSVSARNLEKGAEFLIRLPK